MCKDIFAQLLFAVESCEVEDIVYLTLQHYSIYCSSSLSVCVCGFVWPIAGYEIWMLVRVEAGEWKCL